MQKIELTRGLFATVDDSDYEALAVRSWYASKTRKGYYAAARIDGKIQYMHRVLLGVSDRTVEVDHINQDPLDNSRENLRCSTRSENSCNRGKPTNNLSGFKGVYRHSKNPRWIAQIQVARKMRYLGSFDTKEEAHAVYCKAAAELHGEFARTE